MKRLLLATALFTTVFGSDVNTATTAAVKDTHDAGGSAPTFRLPGAPASDPQSPVAVVGGEAVTVTGTVAASPTAVRPGSRRVTPQASRSRQASAPVTGKLTNSTAYCETGLMANGQHTFRGAVASNTYPLGTRLRVSDSPYGPGVFTVADRIGHGSQLDFAIPGDCPAARSWGRRDVQAVRL